MLTGKRDYALCQDIIHGVKLDDILIIVHHKKFGDVPDWGPA